MEKKKAKELVKVEPTKALSPFEEMERWFEDFFRRPFSLMRPSWFPRLRFPEIEEISPSVDVFEEGDNVVVKAELPGMTKEDIDVKVTDDVVTISGEKKKEEKVEKKDYYRMERSYGSFTRSFRLPAEVQTEKATAKFKDGVLEVRIPKTEEAKKKEKKVEIA
ncbi:MAG: Hsp20/alpha crystallin family protein [Nitrospira sp.]|nr:Hsp20/alpha crystallin family protein [Nitrospira sp.]